MSPSMIITQAPDEVMDKLFVPELIEYNAARLPECDAFVYESPIGRKNLTTVSWKIFNEAVKKGAQYVSTRIAALETKPVVGVLVNLDSLTYTALLGGLWLVGAVPFLISTRNSPAALAHLMTKTNVMTLVVSGDEQMQSLAAAALRILSGPDGRDVKLVAAPSHTHLYAVNYTKTPEWKLPFNTAENDPALILHSSGSTAFPKPIVLTHHVVRQWTLGFRQPEATLGGSGTRLAAHALPMFHGIAVGMFLCTIGVAGCLGVFPPSDKPVVPSPELFLNAAIATECDILFTVPSFLEGWSRDIRMIEKLRTFKAVAFGGGPLGRDFGNSLWDQGVKILSCYGITETGLGSVLFPEPYPDWEYIKLLGRNAHYFRPIEGESGHYELIFLKNERSTPSIINTEINGIQGYATNDVVEKHPTDSTKVRILGRIDDQIMLSTGEKTNPGPLEAIISRNPLVSAAIMFGRGREQNGVIVQPVVAIDHTDQAAVSKFRNDIWPSVEEANRYAPTHSRIFKEMIIVVDQAKPFQCTPKGTIKRKPTLADYESEIDATYAAIEESAQENIAAPSSWTTNDVCDFVRQVVEGVMEKKLDDEDDIFLHGGDSLRATWIRNSLLRAIRWSPHAAKAHDIGQDFVFSNPTIAALASSLHILVGVDNKASTTEDAAQKGIEEIESLVATYTQNFPTHRPDRNRVLDLDGEVVLVTGTTGGLGAQLVATLAADSTVARVYAFNRPAQEPIVERQRKAFFERGLDTALLDGGKVVLVEGNTEEKNLGISKETFNEMRDSLTLVIHNAWKVNFVLGLSAFTPLVKGARNIVDFCLSSPRPEPPRIIFTSSVAVVSNWDFDGLPHEGPVETRTALSNGYGRSKYVVERILEAASARTPLKPVVVRVGQMTSTASGAWNKTDWLPAIVRSGQVIGVLPDRDDDVAWFPLDLAANAIYEFRTTESTHLNLEHPTPYSWSSIFREFSARLNVPLTPWPEWLAKLEEATDRNPERMAKINPASMLVTFFKAAPASGTPGKEAPGNIPFLALEKAIASSASLRKARDETVDVEGNVQKWVAHWKAIGHLD